MGKRSAAAALVTALTAGILAVTEAATGAEKELMWQDDAYDIIGGLIRHPATGQILGIRYDRDFPKTIWFTGARRDLQESLNGMHTVAFLVHILHYADRWLVIWDRSPIHRRAEVKESTSSLPRRRIQIEFLPAYAPDLNPVEWAWRHLKYVEMRNLVCLDLEELHQEFHMAMGRLRRKPRLFESCFKGADLQLDPK